MIPLLITLRYERDVVMQKELPVTIPQNFTAAFFYAFPVACILADPDYLDWYHMNYLDFYGYKNEANKAKYEFRYVDAISYIDRILHKNEAVQIDRYDLNYFTCQNLVEFIKSRIDTWNYVILYVDESKIPDSPFGAMDHEYLVYGYNDDEHTFQMLGMNRRRQFTKLSFSYDVITAAVDSLIHNLANGKVMYQLCVTNRYTSLANGENRYYSHHIRREYEEEIFLHKLRTYLSGRITEGSVQIINPKINPQIGCGIETIEILKRYLREVMDGENDFEFNVPFFLLDDKRGIYERLLYAYQKTQKQVYRKAANEYTEIVSQTDLFKNLHMKYLTTDHRDTRKLIERLDAIANQEAAILKQL